MVTILYDNASIKKGFSWWKVCCFGNFLPDWKSVRTGSSSNRRIGFEKDYFWPCRNWRVVIFNFGSIGNISCFWEYVNSSCIQVWGRKRACVIVSVLSYSCGNLLWSISVTYFIRYRNNRPANICSAMLFANDCFGLVLYNVSN